MRLGRTLVTVIAAALVACAAAPAFGAPVPVPELRSGPRSPRVYLVIPTGLEWRDITASATPTMWRMSAEGALGNCNARNRTHEKDEPVSALDGALDISAGALATPDYLAGGALDATETRGGVSAQTLFARRTGLPMAPSQIALPDVAGLDRANEHADEGAVFGTLGQAVRSAGGVTVAIGNSDSLDASAPDGVKLLRPAADLVADRRGLVGLGEVSRSLLASDAAAPYGMSTNLGAFVHALSAAEASASAQGGPALIALDPGDEYRARRDAPHVTEAIRKRMHRAAVAEADDVVAIAIAHSRPGDVVIVATLATPSEIGHVQGLQPLLVSGAGLRGYLTSASTHRVGLVTSADVTAFVLASLRIAQPPEVIGTTMSATPAPSGAQARIRSLSARDLTAVAVLAAGEPFATALIAALVALMLAASALLLWRGRQASGASRVARAGELALRAATLALLAVPAACWAMFIPTREATTLSRVWLLLGGAWFALFALALLAWRFAGPRVAIALLPLATGALLLGDQLLGAPLSATNLLGYSPLQGARYYGIGNEAAALLVGSALVGVALLADGWPDASWTRALSRWGIPVLGAVVVVACAAPMLGANVGVAIWATLGFFAMWMRANGWKITWQRVVLALLVVALLLGAFSAIDVLGHGPKTHLARTISGARGGGPARLALTVSRKALTSARVLVTSRWPLVLLATLVLLCVAWRGRERTLSRVLAENPALSAALLGAACAGAVALVTEDTGILVPTFLWVPVGLVAVWLLVGATARTEAA